jgi:hypothetical protein
MSPNSEGSNPIQNLILSVVAILAAFFYPQIPFLAPISSGQFVEIVQLFLISIAGWNLKAAAFKSGVPSFGYLFKKKL